MNRRGGLARLAAGLEKAVSPAVMQGARIIKDEAVGSIMEGSSSFGRHVVSRPGEAPNNNLGDLVRGIDAEEVAPLKAIVSSTSAAAAPLELGTSRMAARPYMSPAAINKAPDVAALIGKAIDNATRKLGAA